MSPRPLMVVVAEQQRQIDALKRDAAIRDVQFAYLAKMAGVTKQVEAIRKKADIDNPAQPVPAPPSESAFETTEQAVTPEAHDDVRNPGMTPGSVGDVPADTTDVALAPGESLPTSPYNELENVEAPVAGTETHVPNEQTRIETDVRVGNPMAPGVAFPWGMGPNRSNASRTTASIRLARLQVSAGLAHGDDLALGAQIEASEMSDRDIATMTATLEATRKAASATQGRPTNLVPRSASVQRTTPSLAGGNEPLVREASNVDDDTRDADLFD